MRHNFVEARFSFSLLLASLAIALAANSASAQTFSWASAGVADDNSVDGAVLNASTGPVTMNVSVTSSISGGGVNVDAYSNAGQGPASYENDGSFGSLSNFLEVGFDNTSCDTNDRFAVTLSFSAPVNNLQLLIADIDQSSWDDVLEIDLDVDGDGLGAQNIKTFLTNSATGAPLLTLGASVVEDNESFADGYEGTTSVGSGSTAGNVALDTSSTSLAINSVTIRYFSGDDGSACNGGNPGSQRIGIGNVQFSGTTVPVTLSYFRSSRNGQALDIEWETAQEVGHAGFQLYWRADDGWQVLTPSLIPTTGVDSSLASRQYMLSVPMTQAANFKWLSLVDVSVNEEVVPHGPFRVGKAYGGKILEAAKYAWSPTSRPPGLNSPQQQQVAARIQQALDDDERQQRVGGQSR